MTDTHPAPAPLRLDLTFPSERVTEILIAEARKLGWLPIRHDLEIGVLINAEGDITLSVDVAEQ